MKQKDVKYWSGSQKSIRGVFDGSDSARSAGVEVYLQHEGQLFILQKDLVHSGFGELQQHEKQSVRTMVVGKGAIVLVKVITEYTYS